GVPLARCAQAEACATECGWHVPSVGQASACPSLGSHRAGGTGFSLSVARFASREARPSRTSQVHPDRLGLRVLLQRVAALVAAEAGLLEAAEGEGRIVEVVRVHPYRAGLDGARHAVRLRDVAGPDRGG